MYIHFSKNQKHKILWICIKIKDFTPKPIGYIEFYKFGLLDESYFVSEKFDYDFTIREPLLDINFPNKNEILKAFCKIYIWITWSWDFSFWL